MQIFVLLITMLWLIRGLHRFMVSIKKVKKAAEQSAESAQNALKSAAAKTDDVAGAVAKTGTGGMGRLKNVGKSIFNTGNLIEVGFSILVGPRTDCDNAVPGDANWNNFPCRWGRLTKNKWVALAFSLLADAISFSSYLGIFGGPAGVAAAESGDLIVAPLMGALTSRYSTFGESL